MRTNGSITKASWLQRVLHLDGPLLGALLLLTTVGFAILYSAFDQNMNAVFNQMIRFCIALAAMVVVAQIPPNVLKRWSPWLYLGGILLLVLVLVVGDVGKGARRWLDFGIRFQPAEIMKLALPMMVAWFLSESPLPPRWPKMLMSLGLILLPTALIVLQPDLGTSILIAASGFFVLYMAGLRWRYIFGAAIAMIPVAAVMWFYIMHDYQKQRVLTLLDPSRDPLGSGYHIIQSTIALGSGGMFGKGWLAGTQSHLDFLPERHTDFIFAVFGEEFGLIGVVQLLLLYFLIICRGLYIAVRAQDTYSRLLAGSISLTFSVYVFVNTGMVSGILPVVGIPLPLISYGGTSMVTLLAGFGILMSINTHRKLWPT